MNKRERAEYNKKYNIDHQEQLLQYKRQYYAKHREQWKKYTKKYRLKNIELIKQRKKQYRKRNKEKLMAYDKKYQSNPKYRVHYNLWQRKRRKINLKFNISEKMRSNINKSIRKNKNGRHWEDLVGYTLKDLVKRLKKTMPKGYTWQDYLECKLHIDHIIPISAHNFTDSNHVDFKRCWALSNLQLLPARENLSKGNKLYKPFQPALKI